jgi:hypothetical protein
MRDDAQDAANKVLGKKAQKMTRRIATPAQVRFSLGRAGFAQVNAAADNSDEDDNNDDDGSEEEDMEVDDDASTSKSKKSNKKKTASKKEKGSNTLKTLCIYSFATCFANAKLQRNIAQ